MTGALAVAAIVLVQGAGVAEAAPNPGDARPNPNQDIIAQGAGNLASGLFRGIPVGDYADRLADADGRLYLSGLDPSLTDRLRRTGHLNGPGRALEATPVVGESTRAASHDAKAWLVTRHDGGG